MLWPCRTVTDDQQKSGEIYAYSFVTWRRCQCCDHKFHGARWRLLPSVQLSFESESMHKEHLFRGPAPSHLSAVAATTEQDTLSALRSILLGDLKAPDEIPSLPDLIAGVSALADASRGRVTIALGQAPAEFTFVREGEHVRIDCYTTESTPEVLQRGRRVRLMTLLHGCAAAGISAGQASLGTTMGRAMLTLAQGLWNVSVAPERARKAAVTCHGGSLEGPGDDVALAFGFRAQIAPPTGQARGSYGFSDVHALLFEGELWAFARTRRVVLCRGPILPAAQRMTDAVRGLIDAWRSDRDLNIRLRGGDVTTAIRLTGGQVDLQVSGVDGTVVLRRLQVREVALPILRLTADILRRLVQVDRAQSQNLRVAALRQEVRELRRLVRRSERDDGFENQHPDRLRLASSAPLEVPEEPHSTTPSGQPGRLRYVERWSAEIDGLDASSVFPCGDQLVVANPKMTFALSRTDGRVLWSQASQRASMLLVGKVLLRLHASGQLDLLDVTTGSQFAGCRIAPRTATPRAYFAGGGGLPPVAVLTEGNRRLVAVDLRTGELRWRFRGRGGGGLQVRRAGRVLLVTCGDGSIEALDVATGEVVWRYCDRARFCLTPTVVDEVVCATAGEPGGGAGGLVGIDLYSGRRLWQQRLPSAPSAPPVATTAAAIVPFGGARQARIAAISPQSGEKLWVCQDPGLDHGGCALEVDGGLIVNTPRGRVMALDLDSGDCRWSQSLSNPLTDDVPRRLMPRLRHGVLFTPSARVHVLRPTDGKELAQNIPCDLVPDFLEVDAHGFMFVGEESGHLRAYATAPHLSLVVSPPKA